MAQLTAAAEASIKATGAGMGQEGPHTWHYWLNMNVIKRLLQAAVYGHVARPVCSMMSEPGHQNVPAP